MLWGLVHPSPVFVVSGSLHVLPDDTELHWFVPLFNWYWGELGFASLLWTVNVYLYYTCCSPNLLLRAVTTLLSLPVHPEFLIHSLYKLLHLPKTWKVMGGHLNVQSHVQYTGHNSISRGLRTIHHLRVWIRMNVHYARKMALQCLSDGNEVVLGGGWHVWIECCWNDICLYERVCRLGYSSWGLTA